MSSMGTELDVVLGVDPGLDGGLAATSLDQRFMLACPMPVIGKKGAKRELDAGGVLHWLDDLKSFRNIRVCVIEKVHSMPKQGVASTFTFGKSFGMVLGILMARGIPLEHVDSKLWKASILTGTTKDKTAAITYCARRFPSVNLIPEGKRTQHDGMADALCMAEFARRLIKGETDVNVQQANGHRTGQSKI